MVDWFEDIEDMREDLLATYQSVEEDIVEPYGDVLTSLEEDEELAKQVEQEWDESP